MEKLANCDKKYEDEIGFGYMIVSDPQFIKTYQSNIREGWKFLDKSMKIPPTILINNYLQDSTCIEIKRPIYPKCKKEVLHCYLCEDKVADSVQEKIKFMEIKCDCTIMYSHTKCANNFILKYSMCDVCKKYYDIIPHCSTLRSIL